MEFLSYRTLGADAREYRQSHSYECHWFSQVQYLLCWQAQCPSRQLWAVDAFDSMHRFCLIYYALTLLCFCMLLLLFLTQRNGQLTNKQNSDTVIDRVVKLCRAVTSFATEASHLHPSIRSFKTPHRSYLNSLLWTVTFNRRRTKTVIHLSD